MLRTGKLTTPKWKFLEATRKIEFPCRKKENCRKFLEGTRKIVTITFLKAFLCIGQSITISNKKLWNASLSINRNLVFFFFFAALAAPCLPW